MRNAALPVRVAHATAPPSFATRTPLGSTIRIPHLLHNTLFTLTPFATLCSMSEYKGEKEPQVHAKEHAPEHLRFSPYRYLTQQGQDIFALVARTSFPQILEVTERDVQRAIENGLPACDLFPEMRAYLPLFLEHAMALRFNEISTASHTHEQQIPKETRESIQLQCNLQAVLWETVCILQKEERELRELLGIESTETPPAIARDGLHHEYEDGGGSGITRRTVVGAALATVAVGALWKGESVADWVLYKAKADILEKKLSARYHATFRAITTAQPHPVMKRNRQTGEQEVMQGTAEALETHRARVAMLEHIQTVCSVYPDDFLVENGIRTITLADHLTQSNGRKTFHLMLAGNFAVDTVGIFGYAEIEKRIDDPSAIQKTIHHEIGHAFTLRSIPKELWVKEIYGDEKKQQQAHAAQRGFAREYGMKDHMEDMATVFEKMFTEPEIVLYPQRRKSLDPLLAKKITFLARHIEEQVPEMNMAYWRDRAERKIDAAYWAKGGIGYERAHRN